ncbi:hypothetical protein BJY04DRAFT_214121 [Aspergillus karnatakaensis]|uniref:ankyrin repeat domain-containing protein n=1 Tax=Aspergillus karnatakaensis TaxID=1810916 RepID=UPI003CCD3D2A
MPLETILNEIIYQIVSDLRTKDCNDLARTCCFFHSLLNPYLYKHHANTTILKWSIDKQNPGTISHLFAYNPPIDETTLHSALWRSCQARSLGIFTLIINQYARLDYETILTCLLWAADFGCVDILHMTLECDSIRTSEWARSFARLALFNACHQGSARHLGVVKLLLSVYNDLPIDYAINHSLDRRKEALTIFLINHARVHRKRFFLTESNKQRLREIGEQAVRFERSLEEERVMQTCIDGDHQALKHLIQVGVRIPAEDANGITPLAHAISKGHIEVVRVLVRNGMPDYRIVRPGTNHSVHNYDLVSLAIHHGQNDIFRMLLDQDNGWCLFFKSVAAGTAHSFQNEEATALLNGVFEARYAGCKLLPGY